MSNISNKYGRAYEFVYIKNLYKEISKFKKVSIIENNNYLNGKNYFDLLTQEEKNIFNLSSISAINTIINLEPKLFKNDAPLSLKILSDDNGINGDVRDIVITNKNIDFEVGLSIKHNHFAVKHSRLSKNIDFGEKWYGIKCSNLYWNEIREIFDFLEIKKEEKKLWKEILDKENKVYIPLLNAFKNEILRQNKKLKNKVPLLLVEYLIGKFDFYKIVSIDRQKLTKIFCFNLKNTLNKQLNNNLNNILIPNVKLPSKILSFEFKENTKSTLELKLDNDWQFNFRIHNASSKVETSLKFDIQLVKMPNSIYTIDCIWDK